MNDFYDEIQILRGCLKFFEIISSGNLNKVVFRVFYGTIGPNLSHKDRYEGRQKLYACIFTVPLEHSS